MAGLADFVAIRYNSNWRAGWVIAGLVIASGWALEESPDTVVVGSQEPVTKQGGAPGNARGPVVQTLWHGYGKCHRE